MTPRIGILGSGFGLYGHLPAFTEIGRHRFTLLERYQRVFSSRTDLADIAHEVLWVNNEEQLLRESDVLVFSRNPELNHRIILEQPDVLRGRRVILEKPPSNSANQFGEILPLLALSEWTICFPLRFTSWARELRTLVNRGRQQQYTLRVQWSFMANHLLDRRPTWKQYHSRGGGPFRFYGIHFVAILAELGKWRPVANELTGPRDFEPTRWRAEAEEESGSKAILKVNSADKKDYFGISFQSADENWAFESQNPFSMTRPRTEQLSLQPDYRIRELAQHHREFLDTTKALKIRARNIEFINLWRLFDVNL